MKRSQGAARGVARFVVLNLLAVGLAAVSSADAEPVQWTAESGGNGHWYEFVDAATTWQAAKVAAGAKSHLGMVGYLGTITSYDEQRFILSTVSNSAMWLGGTDEQTEGTWKWVTGPETGQVFFGPGVPVGAFSYWYPGEPNNMGLGEHYLHMGLHAPGGWNDNGAPN